MDLRCDQHGKPPFPLFLLLLLDYVLTIYRLLSANLHLPASLARDLPSLLPLPRL